MVEQRTLRWALPGYRVDVRGHGDTAWHSLATRREPRSGATTLGTFDGELGVEINAINRRSDEAAQWWLPSYFDRSGAAGRS